MFSGYKTPDLRMESRLVYMDHIVGRGTDLFAAVCARDLEGIVAKWKRGRYHSDGQTTSWLKIRNASYSQVQGRPELFGARRVGAPSKSARPRLCAELQSFRRAR
jgi:ATP-dependent DNA ligase